MKDLNKFYQFCRKIVCVGLNYHAHAVEVNMALPKTPLLFLKPPTSIITQGELIERPVRSNMLHHEVELGVVIEKGGRHIDKKAAFDHVGGYVLALDMTARDLAQESDAFMVGKCWDTFCPISNFIPKSAVSNPNDLHLWCNVNNEKRQNENTKDMIFNVEHIISYISGITTLERGDLILTGTPKGVGPVSPGDKITCGIKDIVDMEFKVKL